MSLLRRLLSELQIKILVYETIAQPRGILPEGVWCLVLPEMLRCKREEGY
jgi:hypothetical protein